MKTSAPLDYEAASTYDIVFLAKGSDGSSTSNSFQIYVEEVDEWFDPVFTKNLHFDDRWPDAWSDVSSITLFNDYPGAYSNSWPTGF